MEECQPKTLDVMVQNSDILRDFPIVISFRVYLIILYAVRFLMLQLISFLMLLLGRKISNIRKAYIIGLGIFVIPSLFYVLGIEVFKWFSFVIPVSGVEALWYLGK